MLLSKFFNDRSLGNFRPVKSHIACTMGGQKMTIGETILFIGIERHSLCADPLFYISFFISSCVGGGFGPVADDGYGVCYCFTGEGRTNFHISSKRSYEATNSQRFADCLDQALKDILSLYN